MAIKEVKLVKGQTIAISAKAVIGIRFLKISQ